MKIKKDRFGSDETRSGRGRRCPRNDDDDDEVTLVDDRDDERAESTS